MDALSALPPINQLIKPIAKVTALVISVGFKLNSLISRSIFSKKQTIFLINTKNHLKTNI